jgi:GDP-L-fucose synthase
VGVGEDLSILELTGLIAETTGWRGDFITDSSKPAGSPRKLLDVSRMTALDWTARASLKDGLSKAHEWYSECESRA